MKIITILSIIQIHCNSIFLFLLFFEKRNNPSLLKLSPPPPLLNNEHLLLSFLQSSKFFPPSRLSSNEIIAPPTPEISQSIFYKFTTGKFCLCTHSSHEFGIIRSSQEIVDHLLLC